MYRDKENSKIGTIKRLYERVRVLADSGENKRRLQLWESYAGLPNVFPRYLPKEGLPVVPFIADLDREMWAPVVGVKIEEIYKDPYSYAEYELSKKIYAFEEFHDDNPITKDVVIRIGPGFFETLLGLEQKSVHGHEPWVGKEPIIREKEDLESLKLPDFYHSGLAPVAHQMYSYLKEVVDDDFNVIFPEWDSGPFGMASHVRGIINLCIDMIEDPQFVHRLMEFVLESKMEWSMKRAQLLGIPIKPCYLVNDDINIPIISPNAYKNFVLPYEKKISKFHKGVDYWHSCGKIDPVLPYIKQIPNLKMIHVSHLTCLEKSVEIIGRDHIIEIVLDSINDVEKATPQQMENKLRQIKSICQGLHFTVRADAFQVVSSLASDLEQIKIWIDKARQVLS